MNGVYYTSEYDAIGRCCQKDLCFALSVYVSLCPLMPGAEDKSIATAGKMRYNELSFEGRRDAP